MNHEITPRKKQREARNSNIRFLYKRGYSMNQIVLMTHHSKPTIFRAIHEKVAKPLKSK